MCPKKVPPVDVLVEGLSDRKRALNDIREDLGNCTRCPLHKQGRKQIVFGDGNPNADLMFVGEGPGADEDKEGKPFQGAAGDVLNKMFKDMDIERSQVYIANIVMCRPPGNRKPKREEYEKCLPFLMGQIAAIKPRVIVALGATAAKRLLRKNSPVKELRKGFHGYRPVGLTSMDSDWKGCKLKVTYHPKSRGGEWQKGEAWKDLQMVMKELGLKVSGKKHVGRQPIHYRAALRLGW